MKTKEMEENKETALALETIRPELNLEKWSIWQPAHTQSEPTRKTIQREIQQPDGSRAISKVEVGFTDRGVLTTEDQKTYYALIKLFEEWKSQRRSTEFIYLSLRKLAKTLKKKWGTNVIESLTTSLIRLHITPFIWTNSFYNTTTKVEEETIGSFRILEDLKIKRRKEEGKITKAKGYFQFNNFILKNLLANHTKPLYLDTILNFKSEIAQLLYSHLDLILAHNSHYERRTKELFEDLNLEGKAYKNPSNRKQRLQKALAELQNLPLSTGWISSISLERTKDKKDWKLSVYKSAKKPKPPTEQEPAESRGEPTAPTFRIRHQELKPINIADLKEQYKADSENRQRDLEARLNSLSPEDRQALKSKVRTAILGAFPILEGREDGPAFKNAFWNKIEQELNQRDQPTAEQTAKEPVSTEPESSVE